MNTQANSNPSTPAPLPADVIAIRAELRAHIPSYYSAVLHFMGTTCLSLPLSIYALTKITPLAAKEWLMIPFFLVFASLVEYITHRFPLHRPLWPLKPAYTQHTLRHHYFFTHDAIEYELRKDFKQVFFPVWGVALLQYGIALPQSLLVGYLVSPNAGYLALIIGSLFFFTYETVHMICHLKTSHWVFKIPGLLYLREHHRIHHNKARMGKYNFNIVFPLWDFILGTRINK